MKLGAGLSLKSDLKGQKYVYYERLSKDTFYDKDGNERPTKKLYEVAKKELNSTLNEAAGKENLQQSAEFFRKMAIQERKKESSLLAEVFQKDDFKEKVNAKKIIAGINAAFNLESVLDRTLNQIQNGGKIKEDGTKSTVEKRITSHFPTYFLGTLGKTKEYMVEQVLSNVKANKNKPTKELFVETYKQNLPYMVRETLLRMYTESNVEHGVDKEFKDAYKELADEIENCTNIGNEFVNELINGLGLKGIIDDMFKSEELSPGANKKNITKNLNQVLKIKKSNASVKALEGAQSINSLGGTTTEVLGAAIARVSMKKNGVSGRVFHTGKLNEMKADIIMAFNFEDSDLKDWYKVLEDGAAETRVGDSKREKNIGMLKEAKGKLTGDPRKFLVFVNAKEYSLTENFRKKGYEAGTMTLSQFESMLSALNQRANNFIFAALQLVPKAIGESKKNEVAFMYSRLIAAQMFDDIEDIGVYHNQKGVNSIHLLYLNGTYIPLSVYFELIAKSIDQMIEHYTISTNLINVNIKEIEKAKTDFQDIKDHDDGKKSGNYWKAGVNKWRKKYPGEYPWVFQRNAAYNAIKIKYYFMRNFERVISSAYEKQKN